MRIGYLGVAVAIGALPVLAAAQDRAAVEAAVRGDATFAEVEIRTSSETPSYAVRSRDEGRVVVIDLVGMSLGEGALRTDGSIALVSATTSGTTPRGARIELTTTRAVSYRARVEGRRVIVRIEALDETRAATPTAPREQVQAAGEPEATGAAVVRAVRVETRDGRDRVVIELDHAAPYRVVPGRTGPARLEIAGATLGAEVDAAIAGHDDGIVRGVRVRRSGDRAVLEVDRMDGAQGTAMREGSRIVWLFARPERGGPQRQGSRVIAREAGFEEPVVDDGGEPVDTDEVAAFLTDVPLQVRAARGRRYSGRRIDIDMQDASIHQILRLLAEVGDVNIITSDDVSGTVTLRMQNVPWDQALDVILQAKGLGMVRRGNMIRVAPLTTLEKERELAISRQKQEVELATLETRLVPVSYATAEDLQARVRELLSPRGTVSVDERTNVLIIRDVIEQLDQAEELVRSLDTQTPQVLVEARIVEATSQYSRDVGIQWGGDVTQSTLTGNPTGLVFPGNLGIAGGNYDTNTPTAGLSPFERVVDPSNFAVNLPAATGTGQGGALGITLGSIGGNVNLNIRLSALESNGSLRIISSPRILTLDNHEAHIAQGTLIPYSQISAQGVQTAFQEAKLELRVRPHVTSDGSISMHVKLTRDEPDFTRTSARGDPTILKREAETDLLVPDGHTAVIGGIYTRQSGRNVEQVPFFGDIPIIGVLFQRRRVRDDRQELLIFLTPRIVNRIESVVQ